MGEALLSGLLRAGRPADDLLVVGRRAERAALERAVRRRAVVRGRGGAAADICSSR